MVRKYSFLIGVLLLCCQPVYSNESVVIIPAYNTKVFHNEIVFLYKHLLNDSSTRTKKIEKISRYFLGRKYVVGPLGEGRFSLYDKNPLFRTDAFDCVTYVSTVLALVSASNRLDFEQALKKIQYKNSLVSYFNRNHFIEVDWNSANEENGLIKDITTEISPHCKVAHAIIDKPKWFAHLSPKNLKCFIKLSDEKVKRLMALLHRHGAKLKCVEADTSYIPLTEIIHGQIINKEILDRIPTASIIEIIDKNRDFKNQIHTDLNIAHLGFAIRTEAGLLFRHASTVHHKVVEVPLVQYLKRYYDISVNPEKVGIHVEVITCFLPSLQPSGATTPSPALRERE